jgi:hypothetical protein
LIAEVTQIPYIGELTVTRSTRDLSGVCELLRAIKGVSTCYGEQRTTVPGPAAFEL